MRSQVRSGPTRTCIGCGQKGNQTDLIRIRLTVEGRLVHGETGEGRSAYVCRATGCIERGLGKNRLARALRSEVTSDAVKELERELICKPQ